eukprot:623128-Rhodomonas_salina.2
MSGTDCPRAYGRRVHVTLGARGEEFGTAYTWLSCSQLENSNGNPGPGARFGHSAVAFQVSLLVVVPVLLGPARRNQTRQKSAAVQFVRGERLFVFDFAFAQLTRYHDSAKW